MKGWLGLFAFAWIAAGVTAQAHAQAYGVSTRSNVEFAEHDGVKLAGDLYLPKGLDKAPVLIAVHGGGWQIGGPVFYRYWGPFLAKHGIALFAVRYRLSKPGAKSFPGAVYDVKAAIQFARANATQLGVDPDRIGLIGDSAGAHLVSLVALAGDEPLFSDRVPRRPARRHAGQREGGDRLLRRLRHAGAVARTTRSRARATRSPRNSSASRRCRAAAPISMRRR